MKGSLILENLIFFVMYVSLGGFISHFSLIDTGAVLGNVSPDLDSIPTESGRGKGVLLAQTPY